MNARLKRKASRYNPNLFSLLTVNDGNKTVNFVFQLCAAHWTDGLEYLTTTQMAFTYIQTYNGIRK